MAKGTEVFEPVADDYARYRPGYPKEVLEELTALLTDLFTRHQCSGTVEFHYIARMYFGR